MAQWRGCLIHLWLLSAIPAPAFAQVGGGALSVVVADQAGAAVPGATVTAIATATNAARMAVSGTEAGSVFQGLPPGLYQVHVELSGFRPITRDGIRVSTGETIRLDVELEVGGLTEAITVTGDASLLRSQTSGLGQVDLPLNGRSFITLASLAPTVALPPGSQLPRINGGRPRTNVVARRSDDSRRPAASALPSIHVGQPVSQQRGNDHLSRCLREGRAAVLEGARPSRI
jgi:hypothetical protein